MRIVFLYLRVNTLKYISPSILSRSLCHLLVVLAFTSCNRTGKTSDADVEVITTYQDTVFWQEYHEAWPVSDDDDDNDVRRIVVDHDMSVWIATGSGVFRKHNDQKSWVSVQESDDKGPSFSVALAHDSSVWMSTWKGIYRFKDGALREMKGATPPIAFLSAAPEGVYALGAHGVWLYNAFGCEKKDYALARSIRTAISDPQGGLWVGTDVGLYHLGENNLRHFVTPEHLTSAYVRGLSFDNTGLLWAAGLGGVSILDNGRNARTLLPENGLPSIQSTCVTRGPGGVMWVGTDKGVVRFGKDDHPTLRFSRRWLLDDKVNDIAFDKSGNAWIATARGVSAIKRKRMTLAGKAAYFYDVLMRRHIREPWIAGQCKLPIAGDTTVWEPDDDDNDGEYTGTYLAMESFRYAATGNPEAKENAQKAFRFLTFLQAVTGKKGFFARTIVPAHWQEVHDPNRNYTVRQLADERVKEPRFKPVETRWHRSEDGKWLWKGDTSSDEMCGHMMGYFFYYELVADEQEKQRVAEHVAGIVDQLAADNFNLVDVDGSHTRWGVWSPSKLNDDPEWMPDRSLNSMELLSFMKLAFYVTGNAKYQNAYRELIDAQGYLDNMSNIPNQNPGWFIYYDVMLAAYQYPILLKCEKDPDLLAFYEKHIDTWLEKHKHDRNPLFNFIYCYARGKRSGLAASVDFLQDTPLDLVDWPIDHRLREDIQLVRHPVLDDVQVNELPPASIRGTIRWDKNPYVAVSGNPHVEREPVFWLLPYWMGRYLGMIELPAASQGDVGLP